MHRSPVYLSPVPGETSREAVIRRDRNRENRMAWNDYLGDRCAYCRHVRFHVGHETDPATSPEGRAYHETISHHAFVEDSLGERHAARYAAIVGASS